MTPTPEPIPRDRCLAVTLGRDDCRCKTCSRELAAGIRTAEQFEAAAEARRRAIAEAAA